MLATIGFEHVLLSRCHLRKKTVCALTLITCPRLKQTKSENNSLTDHLFFNRLCISYNIYFSAIFGHYLQFSSWCKWRQALMHPYSTILYLIYAKVEWYQLFTINKVDHLLKSLHFQHLVLWEYLEITFDVKWVLN